MKVRANYGSLFFTLSCGLVLVCPYWHVLKVGHDYRYVGCPIDVNQ